MPKRSGLALACSVLIAACAAADPSGEARLIGAVDWRLPAPDLYGLSGLDIAADGGAFVAIGDAGQVIEGRIERDNGVPTGVTIASTGMLRSALGGSGGSKQDNDAEGLALLPGGRYAVSFEGEHRVLLYDDLSGAPRALPRNTAFAAFPSNAGLEALAAGPDGAIYAIPERSGALTAPFPVFVFADGAWQEPLSIPRRGDFLVVGADVGPEGRLYLLERRFLGVFGFASRVRRFDLAPGGLTSETTVLTSPPGLHDNLEGIAAWRGPDGRIRLTMVSDNNNSALQRTEIVEYELPD